jgi:hypothetical protein
MGGEGWNARVEPLIVLLIADAIRIGPVALVTTLISALRSDIDKLEMLRRYIFGDPTMETRDRMAVLVDVMIHVGIAYPVLKVKFIVPHALAQLSETFEVDLHRHTPQQRVAAGVSDVTIVLSCTCMAMYARDDPFNCGESHRRSSPSDRCFVCYRLDDDAVFTECESPVCYAAMPGVRHALMCATCIHDFPLLRFRTRDGMQ